MAVLRSIPLLALIWILYNVVAFFGVATMGHQVFSFSLTSGAVWTINVGELLIIVGLLAVLVRRLRAGGH